MKEILINSDYGGYALNYAVVQKIADLNKDKVYWYVHTDTVMKKDPVVVYEYGYKRIPFNKVNENDLSKVAVTIKDYGDSMLVTDIKRYKYDLFNLNVMHQNDKNYRIDKLIIESVKQLGLKKSSGNYCKLKIVQIPNDTYFTILNDYGKESVVYTLSEKMHKVS